MNYARGYPDDAYEIEARPEASGGAPPLFDLRKALTFVWRSKVKIAIGAVIGVCLSLIQIATMTPTYTATATVLFKPDRRNIVNIQDVLASPPKDDLRNQIEILRSKTLMTRVVSKLNLTVYNEFNPRLVSVDGPFDNLGRFLDWRTYVPWGPLADLGVIEPPNPVVLTEEEREALDIAIARDKLANLLSIQPVPESRVIRLSVTLANKRLSALVANAIAQEYITAQLDAGLAATREATIWLTDRVEELKTDLADAEAAVNDYRVELTERTGQTTSVISQQLQNLNEAVAEASAATATAQIRHRRAEDALASTDRIAVIAEFQRSPVITGARERERELISDRAELARLVPEGHERLRLLDLRIEGQREEIRKEAERVVRSLENEYNVAADQEADLRRQVRELERSLQAQSAEEVRLRQLEREADANRLIYENFLGRLKETTQQQTLEEADAVVISPAEMPRRPDIASKKRVAFFGLMLGAMLGLGMSYLLERLNNTFRGVEEVQEATGLPVLGTVPWVGRSKERQDVLQYVLEKPSSSLAEAIRSLRTSLLFSRVDEPPQVIMFTSTVPSEGKSTTSLLLALTSAQMGRSAIIVDCDLRRPALNAFFGDRAVQTSGLRGVLDGSLALEDATIVDPVTGLTILSTRVEEGAVINAADVLASDKFGKLLSDLRERYDLVILDAPPTLSVTDSRIISRRVDTTLYCVRWDSTPRETVLEGLREFSLVKPNIAGIVVSMVNTEQASRYGYSAYGGYYRGNYGDPYHAN